MQRSGARSGMGFGHQSPVPAKRPIPYHTDAVQAWLAQVSQNPTAQMFERLGVQSAEMCGLYNVGPFVANDHLYRAFLAHLLQDHGGPGQIATPEYFDASVAKFAGANTRSLNGVVPAASQLVPTDKAREAVGKLLDLYDHTLAVAHKYRFLPTPAVCPSCRANSSIASIDSGFASTIGQFSLHRSPPPINAAEANNGLTHGVVNPAEIYYAPMPADPESQACRYKYHPCFDFPISRSTNWHYRTPEDCYNSGVNWVPPTSCKYYRESLARELYDCLLEHDPELVIDAPGTRSFISWEELREKCPAEFHTVAWRIVAKIHKIHMYAEEVEDMKFLDRVECVKLLFRKAKGSCSYAFKPGHLKEFVVKPVEKAKTFEYNQSSNQRKKQREQAHVELHMERHGEVPPWKAGKKKPSNHTPSAFPTADPSEASEHPDTSTVIKDEQTTSTQIHTGIEVAAAGSNNRVVKSSASNKRKRVSKATTNLEVDDLDCGTRDAMFNPGPNPTKYRRIAPAPPITPLTRGRNMQNVKSGKTQNTLPEMQPCPTFTHHSMLATPGGLALEQSPLPFQEFAISTGPQWSSLGLSEPLPLLEYSETEHNDAQVNAQFSDQIPHGLSLTGTDLLMGQQDLQGQIPEYLGFQLDNTSVESPSTAMPFLFQPLSPHSTLAEPSEMTTMGSCLENSDQSHSFPYEATFAAGSSFEPMSLGLVDDFWEFAFLGDEDKVA